MVQTALAYASVSVREREQRKGGKGTHDEEDLAVVITLPEPAHKALEPLAVGQAAVDHERALLRLGDRGADFLEERGFGVQEGRGGRGRVGEVERAFGEQARERVGVDPVSAPTEAELRQSRRKQRFDTSTRRQRRTTRCWGVAVPGPF